MEQNTLKLKTIESLLSEHFFVPDYQRGYRWTAEQVLALLQDVLQFSISNTRQGAYYCLQPIVVRAIEREGVRKWELIDGQQRLTTIFIILNYLNQRLTEDFRKTLFSLEYETRKASEDLLKNLTEKREAAYIDDYFINEAYNTIKVWFKDKQSYVGDFESTLLTSTKVIWYELKDSNTSSIDIFTRINIGKIPLTNAELVKALFLQKKNFSDKATLKQIQIATEWDIIEKKLQQDSFWYFIYSSTNLIEYENRIEYIFDLIHGKKYEHEKYYTFNKFQEAFDKNKTDNEGFLNIDALWLAVKKYFLVLEEWYHERELYHLIGFLIEHAASIKDLKTRSESLTKTAFKQSLREEIGKRFSKLDISELHYKRNAKSIREILLLFNIETILSTQDTDMKFPFDKYKKDNWDIEHINSQQDKTILPKDRKSWMLDILEYYTGIQGFDTNNRLADEEKSLADVQKAKTETLEETAKTICQKIIRQIESEHIEEKQFIEIYEQVTKSFIKEDNSQNDSVSNLALLDEYTNRSYGNAMFFIKRKTIIENDKIGVFVPLATKNVFLKYYSKQSNNNLYWSKSDASDYLEMIKNILKPYFKEVI